jgi:hypothetical protein
VAREHSRGRRLFVQTTHLDGEDAVIWDMGAIASSDAPNAPDVFRKVLLASASVPVAFPPVIFEVEVDGETYDEIHADGGVVSQSTTMSAWQSEIGRITEELGDDRKRVFYVVRNGRVDPEPKTIDYNLLDVGGRSVSSLIFYSGISGMIISYDVARARGADYYATWIGPEFEFERAEPFSQEYMKALSQYGYDLMMSGEAWRTAPPLISAEGS